MKNNRLEGMYMVTVPAGACGQSNVDARRLNDAIASAISRYLQRTDYTTEILLGVSDIDPDKGSYCAVRTGSRGRPRRVQTIIPGHEYMADPSPHIHMLINSKPGSTVVNAVMDITNRRLPRGYRANLSDISSRWDNKKQYVVSQAKYIRVIQHGDPRTLYRGSWQFSKYGRRKNSK